MTIVQFEFYTLAEKEPPFNIPLLCRLNEGRFCILTYINDPEYGKVFKGVEGYYMVQGVIEWAKFKDQEWQFIYKR